MLVSDHRRFSEGRVFDIGLGEFIVLAVLALVIFGPEQLPKVAGQAGRFVRQLRETATSARKELTDSTDLAGITDDLKSLADLHPKRMLASTFSDPAPSDPPAPASRPATPKPPTAPGGTTPGAKPGAAFDPDAT